MPDKIVTEIANKVRGQKRTPEQNAAKSARQRGLKKSKEWVEKRTGENHPLYGKKRPGFSVNVKGINHWTYDPTIYIWQDTKTGEIVNLTRTEFKNRLNGASHIHRLMSGERKTVKGWIFLGVADVNPALSKDPDLVP